MADSIPTPATAVRGPLKYEIETSSPLVEAGRPFTVYLRVTNPYELPVHIQQVEFPLPVEFLDETNVEDPDDRLHLREPERPRVAQDGTTVNPFGPHVALAIAATGPNRRPGGYPAPAAAPAAPAAVPLHAAAVAPKNQAEVTIQPGNTVNQRITLRSRRWLLFSPATYHLEAVIAYTLDDKEHRDAVKIPLTIKAPMMALIVGAAIGAAGGGLLQYLYRLQNFSWGGLAQAAIPLLANVVLSGVVIVAFGRKKDAQPFISVEDFWGALFIGFLVGTSGEDWLRFLTDQNPPAATP